MSTNEKLIYLETIQQEGHSIEHRQYLRFVHTEPFIAKSSKMTIAKNRKMTITIGY